MTTPFSAIAARARALLAAVTKHPWYMSEVPASDPTDPTEEGTFIVVGACHDPDTIALVDSATDAVLIAEAPTLLAAALDEVERLGVELEAAHATAHDAVSIVEQASASAFQSACEGATSAANEMRAERDQARVRVAELEAALVRVETWTHEHGTALVPRGADTYGEGKRDAKQEVSRILRAALSPPAGREGEP